jgi:hypothetical protein
MATFNSAQVEALTGCSQAAQRSLRFQGLLPPLTGSHAEYSLGDLAQLVVADLLIRHYGVKTEPAHRRARLVADRVESYAAGYVGHGSIYELTAGPLKFTFDIAVLLHTLRQRIAKLEGEPPPMGNRGKYNGAEARD